jgi:hypothetical protein
MSKTRRLSLVAGAVALVAGCQTTQQMLDTQQPVAMDTALRRGRFDLNCPEATGVLLSDDFIQPALQGPWVMGIQRMEYTIGVEGCGKRTTIVVMCQEGSSTCFAANPNREYQNSPYQNE